MLTTTDVEFVQIEPATEYMPEDQLVFEVPLPSGDGVNHVWRKVPVHVAVPMVNVNAQGQPTTQDEMVALAQALIIGKFAEFFGK